MTIFFSFFCVCLFFFSTPWPSDLFLKQDVGKTLHQCLKLTLIPTKVTPPWLSSGAQRWHWQSLCLLSELSTFVTSPAAISRYTVLLIFYARAQHELSFLFSYLKLEVSLQRCAHIAGGLPRYVDTGERRRARESRHYGGESGDMKIRCWRKVSGVITIVSEQTISSSLWNIEANVSQLISSSLLLYIVYIPLTKLDTMSPVNVLTGLLFWRNVLCFAVWQIYWPSVLITREQQITPLPKLSDD